MSSRDRAKRVALPWERLDAADSDIRRASATGVDHDKQPHPFFEHEGARFVYMGAMFSRDRIEVEGWRVVHSAAWRKKTTSYAQLLKRWGFREHPGRGDLTSLRVRLRREPGTWVCAERVIFAADRPKRRRPPKGPTKGRLALDARGRVVVVPGSAVTPRRARKPARTPALERAVAAGGHIKKCLSVDWWTPPELLERVRLALTGDANNPIPLDPCAPASNHTRAARFFTIRENGLAQTWDAPWFANVPYGRVLRAWLAKIVREAGTYHAAGVPLPGIALLPCSRWEQGYMHDVLRAASCVCFVRKRIKFVKASSGDRVGGTPMASMFLGFNVDVARFEEAFRDVGLCLAMSRI